MKYYTTWTTVVAVLAIVLPDVSAQIENTIISRRSGISSTVSSFQTNTKNKINEYNSKITSLRTDMTSQLSSAMQTATQFFSDSEISANAEAASDVLDAAIQFLVEVESSFLTSTGTVFQGVNSCLSNKTTAAINATFFSLATTNSQMSLKFSSSSSSYAGTCRGKYGNIPNDLVNQAADKVQECLNNENNQQSRINSILNNYITMIRQNYQGMTNHMRYCSGLGSPSSRTEVKKQISACFKGISTYAGPIYVATIKQQVSFATVMLQLEAVSSNNRVKECINQVTETYNAMSAAFSSVVDACLINGQ